MLAFHRIENLFQGEISARLPLAVAMSGHGDFAGFDKRTEKHGCLCRRAFDRMLSFNVNIVFRLVGAVLPDMIKWQTDEKKEEA